MSKIHTILYALFFSKKCEECQEATARELEKVKELNDLMSNRNVRLKSENEALEKKIKDLEFELLVKTLTEQGEIIDHIKDIDARRVTGKMATKANVKNSQVSF